jgi:type IV secretion system pilin
MKKITKYILMIMIVSLAISSLPAYATSLDAPEGESMQTAFTPPTIPKPSTLPGPTEAQLKSEDDDKNTVENPGRKILINQLIPKQTATMVGFVGVMTFLFLVISGVRYVMSYGDEEAVGKAKTQMIYAIVALFIALLAYTAVSLIINIEFVGNDVVQQTTE